MDGDLEDPPELIPELITWWKAGFNTVYTVKETRHQTWLKKCLTNGYYSLIRRLTKYGVERQAGMYSLIDRKVANVLRSMREVGKSYPNLRSMVGFKQKAITYAREMRAGGEPKQSFPRLVSDALNALFANTYVPIRFFTFLGLISSVLFMMLAFLVLFVRLTGLEFWIFEDIPGTQMILVIVLAAGSLQMTFLGVLGEYILRIYEETKRRPYYIVEEIYSSKESDAGLMNKSD